MNPPNSQRGVLDFRFLIALGVIFVFILGAGYFFYGLQPVSSSSNETVVFKISEGQSFREISSVLSRQNLIKSIGMFKLYSLLTGAAKRIQPGIFNLSADMTVPEIIGTITQSDRNEVVAVIPEGSALADVDYILSSLGVIKSGELLNFDFQHLVVEYPFLQNAASLEGFLFPDTYRFRPDTEIDLVAKRMLANFSAKAWESLREHKDWYTRLILASFLEREVVAFEDRQLVAGILLKRWRSDWPLQVDATITYIKCGGLIRTCAETIPVKDDFLAGSPYNTYQKIGWTPTPIANPGLTAIKAAITPKTSAYWYYLSADSGETVFAKTLDEHNINRSKFL